MSATSETWTVESRCINCMASQSLAPELLIERDGQSVFDRQPETGEEILAAWLAVQVCPVGAVVPPSQIASPGPLFPQDAGRGIYRLGHNTTKSYGAHSYFVEADRARLMIDGPGWSDELAQSIARHGGLDHILLTHKDDVGDTQRYAERFGAQVWIHRADADSAPFATRIIEDEAPTAPVPEIAILAMPGHTRGSVAYLYDGATLFTGDSLAWDARAQVLRGYPQYCWFDWPTQIESIARLAGRGFTQILAGHGGSVTLTASEMDRQIEALVRRETA